MPLKSANKKIINAISEFYHQHVFLFSGFGQVFVSGDSNQKPVSCDIPHEVKSTAQHITEISHNDYNCLRIFQFYLHIVCSCTILQIWQELTDSGDRITGFCIEWLAYEFPNKQHQSNLQMLVSLPVRIYKEF